VLDDNDKPVPGANVSMSGTDQPGDNVTTDRKGAFRFKVCQGNVQLNANDNSGKYGNASAQSGDTNVLLHIGQNRMNGAINHRLKGTVTDTTGEPAAKAMVSVFPSTSGRSSAVRAGTNGEYQLTWSAWPGQSVMELLCVRDTGRNLAALEEVTAWMTNLDAQLKPALTVAGRVEDVKGAPLPGAQISLMVKAGDSYNSWDDLAAATDAQGHYEFKCLPAGRDYMVSVTAKGHSQKQEACHPDPETNRVEITPVVLKIADRVVAGQILNENEKPVSGVNISFSGDDQPSDNMVTDRQGRFHFQVCEGKINLFSGSQFGFAQAEAVAGDTNIVLTLTPPGVAGRNPLNGQPLPDLATVNLAADAAPAGKPVLLCVFDAGKPTSRQVVQTLAQQLAALWQKNITVLGVQSAAITDADFQAWKTANPVVFPVGRVTKKTDDNRWATRVPKLPWLILTDGNKRVVSEGFSLDKLDAQIQKFRLNSSPEAR